MKTYRTTRQYPGYVGESYFNEHFDNGTKGEQYNINEANDLHEHDNKFAESNRPF